MASSASWPSGDHRPALRDEQSRRSGRSGPRRLLHAGYIGSPSIAEPDSAAREFAHGALRIALEVLDHRRPIAHLDAIAEPPVVSAIRTLVAGDYVPGRALGTAVLTRVNVVMVNSDAAELCAAYDRGHRHFALAAHIARTRADHWRMTALRVL
ncbi:Rv3235 family protein [Nocardia colli]|uniref:Rv3235 family protein n=1 Tax=Nocardia colli TaxID=2545717 RepID=UPI001CC368A8|nr:Rv3235 family protein [Nocardia colli]